MKSEDAPPIARLPLEILEAFIEFSPVSSQLSIARVSKLLHSLTLRCLYRHISLTSPAVAVSCCRTLAKNASAAKTVRSFWVQYTLNGYTNSLLASYYSTIRQALLSLNHLQTLRLLVRDPNFVTLFSSSTFSSLRRFECCLTLSDPLISFINRHPRLTHLQISPYDDTEYTSDADQAPQLELPELRHFSGNVQSVSAIRGGNTLRVAMINWHAYDTPLDLVMSTLKRCSDGSLSLLACRRRGWNEDLLEVISTHLPDLLSLHLSNVLLVDTTMTETYVSSVKNLLSRFAQLRRLRVNCIDYWEMGNVPCNLDFDFAAVTDWGISCPSLVEITLPHSDDLSWYRISENVWIPDPTEASGASWLSDAIILKRYPSLNLFVSGLQERPSKPGSVNPIEYMETIGAVRQKFFNLIRTRHPDLFSNETSPGSSPARKTSVPCR